MTYNKHFSPDKLAMGASYDYIEMSETLSGEKTAVPHNFSNIVNGKSGLPKLSEDDTIVSCVGPYSWYYYYLREKEHGRYGIIHDVQTSCFFDYILNHQLCEDYMRERDRVVFLSEFQRQLYIKFFPDTLNEENTFVCNPLLNFFPKKLEPEASEDFDLTLGWVGRVFRAKNFHQVLETFIGVSKELSDLKVRMVVVGVSDKEFEPPTVKKRLKKYSINPEFYVHLNEGKTADIEKVWSSYGKMDVFLFPSVANIESLGRVVLEANHSGIPVVASSHGAVSDLIPDSNMVKTEYFPAVTDITQCNSLGKIDVDEMTEKIVNYKKLKLGDNILYKNHDEKLFRFIRGEAKEPLRKLPSKVRRFIEGVNLYINPDFNPDRKQMVSKSLRIIKSSGGKQLDLVRKPIEFVKVLNYYPKVKIE